MNQNGIAAVTLIIIFIFQAHLVTASNPADTTCTPEKRYRIGFTGTALINRLPGLQLTQTYRLGKFFSADLETIFSFGDYFLDERFVRSIGYRVRPGIRIHLTPKRKNNDISLKFLIHYRNVKIYFEDNNVIRANGAYTEDIRETVDSELLGYGATIDFRFNDLKARIHFGTGFVYGYQFTAYSSQEIPDNGFTFMQSIMNPGKTRAYLPIAYLHYLF